MSDAPCIEWEERAERHSARWRSESGSAPPVRVLIADDELRADVAYGHACQGIGLLWRGDFHNGRQLLAALGHRAARAERAALRPTPEPTTAIVDAPGDLFHRHRQARAQRARTLGRLLVPLDADYRIPLRRAPDVRAACLEVYGPGDDPSVTSLRELLGIIGAYEWRRRGIAIDAAGGRIHPHYGVFAPVRREYVDLVAQAPLPPELSGRSPGVAFDVGTGTGVLAAVLLRRGVPAAVATDRDPRSIACARANLEQLGLASRVEFLETDLFPPGRAALVVCNPPWLPARPSSRLEEGIYDPGGQMLRRFLAALPGHLAPGGEGWLILSDLAEHLGLRTRSELLAQIQTAGLQVLGRLEARPSHARSSDRDDPLHAARSAEITSLWRLGPAA